MRRYAKPFVMAGLAAAVALSAVSSSDARDRARAAVAAGTGVAVGTAVGTAAATRAFWPGGYFGQPAFARSGFYAYGQGYPFGPGVEYVPLNPADPWIEYYEPARDYESHGDDYDAAYAMIARSPIVAQARAQAVRPARVVYVRPATRTMVRTMAAPRADWPYGYFGRPVIARSGNYAYGQSYPFGPGVDYVPLNPSDPWLEYYEPERDYEAHGDDLNAAYAMTGRAPARMRAVAPARVRVVAPPRARYIGPARAQYIGPMSVAPAWGYGWMGQSLDFPSGSYERDLLGAGNT